MDRNGAEEPLPIEPRGFVYPRLSPDGRRAVLDDRASGNLWIFDFAAGTTDRLNQGDGAYAYPVWTPDGRRVAYSEGADLSWYSANNTGDPEVVAEGVGRGVSGTNAEGANPYFFTPDGSALAFRDQQHPETDDDLIMISVANGDTLWHLNSNSRERNAELSPNGRWMAYASDQSGVFEILVRPFPEVEEDQIVVSNSGGNFPLWVAGRPRAVLRAAHRRRSARVRVGGYRGTDGPFVLGDRQVVMDWPYTLGEVRGEGRIYDVSLDGQRFLVVESELGPEGDESEVYVVTNWFEELLERMGS